ncbi:MAG: GerMN domain-containing protein [bacterium]
MSDPKSEDAKPASGAGRGNPMMMIFNTAVIVFLIVAAVSVLRNKNKADETPIAVAPSEVPREEGVLSVTLFFASKDAERLVPERREIAVADDAVESVIRNVIGELAAGPNGESAPVLPAGAVAERVFLDDEGMLTLDFDPSLREKHWGGSAAERLTLEAIRQTMAVNFASVRSVQILVGGETVESIGGHIDATRALPARNR